ncbi:MAG: TIGR00282 family metallophosphoesterase [Chloroflexi bacterium]|nr:TIGR00282 family metallophosphoesterase [Chloroflexota bacterium]
MKILVIGDVVGKLGRRTVATLLPDIRSEYGSDFVIANGENAAGGKGLTPSTADELFEAGVDVITSGNHIWEYREIYPVLDSDAPILRPLNYPQGAPGRGLLTRDGIAVVNLMGRVFMPGDLDCPFRCADEAVTDLDGTRVIIVDLHCEATSEKVAMGWYLDGRASAVVGTHTHVATADARVLAKGTAYVTDVGMTGPRDAIIGMEAEPVIERFVSQLPQRFSPVERGPAIFNSVLIDVDENTGRARSIERLDREVA